MNTILSREARQGRGDAAFSRRSGVLRTEPCFTVSALRAPAAIAFSLARSTAMRFRLIRALIALGSDGGLVSRGPLGSGSPAREARDESWSTGCSRKPALLDPALWVIGILAVVPWVCWIVQVAS